MEYENGTKHWDILGVSIWKFILRNISFILEECKERNVKTFVKAFLGFCTKFEF